MEQHTSGVHQQQPFEQPSARRLLLLRQLLLGGHDRFHGDHGQPQQRYAHSSFATPASHQLVSQHRPPFPQFPFAKLATVTHAQSHVCNPTNAHPTTTASLFSYTKAGQVRACFAPGVISNATGKMITKKFHQIGRRQPQQLIR